MRDLPTSHPDHDTVIDDAALDRLLEGVGGSWIEQADDALDLLNACRADNRVTIVSCDAGAFSTMAATMADASDMEDAARLGSGLAALIQIRADRHTSPVERVLARVRLTIARLAIGKPTPVASVPRRSDKPLGVYGDRQIDMGRVL